MKSELWLLAETGSSSLQKAGVQLDGGTAPESESVAGLDSEQDDLAADERGYLRSSAVKKGRGV